MAMAPRHRKLALTGHVTFSVGWLGAVACFLALSVVGIVSQDVRTVPSVYISMAAVGRYVLVPLSVASLLTGLVQSLGTSWGLFRHYWVLAKLMINVFATIVLLMYMQTLDHLGRLARDTAVSGGDLGGLRDPSPVVHSAGALILLLMATTLSVYKPRGMTRYGQRRQQRRDRPASQDPSSPSPAVT